MAFYKNPGFNKQKTNYANRGSWDDEGVHYQDRQSRVQASGANAANRRFGPNAANKAETGYQANLNRRGAGQGYQGRPAQDNRGYHTEGQPSRGGYQGQNRAQQGRPEYGSARPVQGRPAQQERGYQQGHPAAPRPQQGRPMQNSGNARPVQGHPVQGRPVQQERVYQQGRPAAPRPQQGRPMQNNGNARPNQGRPVQQERVYQQGRPAAPRPQQGRPVQNNGSARPVQGRPVQQERVYQQGRPVAPRPEQAGARPDYRQFEARTVVPVAAAAVAMAPTGYEESINENMLCGRNPIREAMKAGRDIEKLLVAKGELSGSAREIVMMAKERRVPVQEVERVRLDEITHNHQGLIAYASAYRYATVEDMLALASEKNEPPFLILLDGITDPHNLGAIIRTAECVGAHGVIVPQRRAVGLTPAAVKASAGAIEHVKVARVVNLTRTMEELKAQGVWMYAADMDGEAYDQVDYKGALGLVIGAEGEGISRLTLEACDKKISLPMMGKLDSLNASVAAGVLLYAMLKGRRA